MPSPDAAKIPPEVAGICAALRERGFAAFIVGGAVRDLCRGLPPHDWDVATSARPEEVMSLFPAGLPTGLKYGTVTVPRGELTVEVTTFRGESAYGDGRHPDAVVFGGGIEEDLHRRDFTVNAMAYDPDARRLVDPFGGLRDLKRRLLRTVGSPSARFAEDALRMLRFYRFLATLGFRPDPASVKGMDPALLCRISPERIRDELFKLLAAPGVRAGLQGLADAGLLAGILPELTAPVGAATQGILPHAIATAEAIGPDLHLRLAALLHDIGKPRTFTATGGEVHFYGHDELGAEMARAILSRLRAANSLCDEVCLLVRLHMFQLPIPPSAAAVRRLLAKAGGPEHLRDLLELRRADIIATGRHYWQAAAAWTKLRDCVEEVLAAGAAFSLKDLAIDGAEIMRLTGLPPGPEVGRLLNMMLTRVLEKPELNTPERLRELLAASVRPQ